jgi:hypothetical protein
VRHSGLKETQREFDLVVDVNVHFAEELLVVFTATESPLL